MGVIKYIAITNLVLVFLALLPAHLAAEHHHVGLDHAFFQRLTAEDGLSQGTVHDIIQDNEGFIWFATNDGLNRYDGYQFVVFRHKPGNEKTISSNIVKSLLPGPEGKLWVGTVRGLNSLNPENGRVKRWNHTSPLANADVVSMSFDRDSVLWIASGNNGLISLDPATGESTNYTHKPGKQRSLLSDNVRMVFADSTNRIWISTILGGLQFLDRETGLFESIGENISVNPDLDNPSVEKMIESEPGKIWFISLGGGLACIDTETMTLEKHPGAASPVRNPYSFVDFRMKDDGVFWIANIFGSGLLRYDISTGDATVFPVGQGRTQLLMHSFLSVFIDRDGNLWAGSNGRGVNMLPAEKRPFISISDSGEADIPIPFLSIRGILAAEDGRHVLVSGYYGFVRVDLLNQKAEILPDDGLIIYALLRDVNDSDVVWLGTEGGGPGRLCLKGGIITRINAVKTISEHKDEEDAIAGLLAYRLLQTEDGLLYVGTDIGLNIYDPAEQTFRFYSHDPDDASSLPGGHIISLYKDKSGTIWVGSTAGGLARYDPAEGNFTRFSAGDKKQGSMLTNRVHAFLEDSHGDFWIGTDMGLHRMNRDEGTFEAFLESDGLPNNVVYGILEDQQGNLWLSTNFGLSAYDQQTNSFRNFSKLDGLPGNEFNTGAYHQKDPSRLFFGGVDGLVAFDPSMITPSRWKPRPVITRISYYGQDKTYRSDFSNQKTIDWDTDIQMLTIDYASLNFAGRDKSDYAYQIDGITEHLIEVGDQRQITLTRPTPGTYNFSIYATNSEGVWGTEPLFFQMVVKPTFYETLFFRVLMAVVILVVVISVFIIRLRYISRQKRRLSKLVKRQTIALQTSNKALKESNKTKDMFFSIIAHDLKNPFNALLGFSSMLREDWDTLPESKKKQYVQTIHDTSERTYQLLLNLLDWSLLQKETNTMKPGRHNPEELIKRATPYLSAQCEMKQISLNIEVPDEDLYVWADADMVTTVIRNLVSNAIKYSHNGGEVSISISQSKDDMVKISVRDQGVGIPPDVLPVIFDQKSIRSTPGTKNEQGTGLGLMLCAEFVRRNGGQIWAESDEGNGSVFGFTLPAVQ